jgi:hypothetical protein
MKRVLLTSKNAPGGEAKQNAQELCFSTRSP